MDDYDKIKNFNYDNLRNNPNDSDVIIDPAPHKSQGIGEYSSGMAMMETNPEEFPEVPRATANSKMKINKSFLKAALANTQIVINGE